MLRGELDVYSNPAVGIGAMVQFGVPRREVHRVVENTKVNA